MGASAQKELEVRVATQTKRCSRCQVHLPVDSFSKKKGTRDGFASRCKPCMRDIQWYIRYGITPEQYSRLLESQDYLCAICRKPEPNPRYEYLSVDHDHTTGEVRGLLCSLCNPMIGYAKNDPEILESAIRYLQERTQ